MKRLKEDWAILKYTIINLLFLLLFLFNSSNVHSSDVNFEIQGNKFTDTDVILSLLSEIPTEIDEDYSNNIVKVLNSSNLFSDVSVNFENNKFIIIIKEFPNIDNIYFKNNKRLKDDDLKSFVSELNLTNLNDNSINLFLNEVKKIYQSFGYNEVKIKYSTTIYEDTNTADLYFDINEGKITKINKIIIQGNKNVLAQELYEIIKSKVRSLKNIFANNNYKDAIVERDKLIISNYYKNKGFIDVQIETKVEFLKTNSVNIYFNILEGPIYSLTSLQLLDENKILNPDTSKLINFEIDKFLGEQINFSAEKINKFRKEISSIIIENDTDFFEIIISDNIINNNIDVTFKVVPIKPKYAKQINIVGNSRTYDYVIRRELNIIEGDAVYKNQIQNLRDKILSLNLFESVSIKEENIDDNSVNLIIEVKEKQTGTFNAGVSVGTLDGFAIVTGLRENNFYGTGRSVDALVNTSEGKNQFKLVTTDRLSYENDANISYSINYKQIDYSKASSYKLDTFSSGIGIGYKLNENLYHNIDLEYVLKDYKITNSSTVTDSILSSSGGNMSYLIKNNIRYSSLNPGFVSKSGNYLNFNNSIETPTSSSNGFIKNLLTLKKYHNINKNILSVQSKIGNIFSLNNKDILTDDKFSLGGKWLRGFDNFGAGPRKSRTSYVGGNNIFVTKFDYSYEISNDTNFPIYLNLFNDYGLLWENKTKPTYSDNSLRSSVGFGIKYYSPIGPMGFSWGFPIMEKEYDINRMFLFSIGNID